MFEAVCLQAFHMSALKQTNMSGQVFSVRVPEELKAQLEFLSRSTRRSKAWLATEANSDYGKKNAWRAQELREAIAEADEGVSISPEAMLAWADSLRNENELLPPKPDVFFKSPVP